MKSVCILKLSKFQSEITPTFSPNFVISGSHQDISKSGLKFRIFFWKSGINRYEILAQNPGFFWKPSKLASKSVFFLKIWYQQKSKPAFIFRIFQKQNENDICWCQISTKYGFSGLILLNKYFISKKTDFHAKFWRFFEKSGFCKAKIDDFLKKRILQGHNLNLASKFAFFEKIITSCLTIKENPKIRRKKPQNQRKSKNLEENSKIEENPKKMPQNISKLRLIQNIEILRSGMYRNQDYLPINPKKRRKSTQKIQKSKKIHESKNREENSKIEENPKHCLKISIFLKIWYQQKSKPAVIFRIF